VRKFSHIFIDARRYTLVKVGRILPGTTYPLALRQLEERISYLILWDGFPDLSYTSKNGGGRMTDSAQEKEISKAPDSVRWLIEQLERSSEAFTTWLEHFLVASYCDQDSAPVDHLRI
jgi:hypothetical protein